MGKAGPTAQVGHGVHAAWEDLPCMGGSASVLHEVQEAGLAGQQVCYEGCCLQGGAPLTDDSVGNAAVCICRGKAVVCLCACNPVNRVACLSSVQSFMEARMCPLDSEPPKRQAHCSPQSQRESLSSIPVTLQTVTLQSQAPASAAAPQPVQPPLLPTACLSPAPSP